MARNHPQRFQEGLVGLDQQMTLGAATAATLWLNPCKALSLWNVHDSRMEYCIRGRDEVGNVRWRKEDPCAVGIRRRQIPRAECCLRNHRGEDEERRGKNDEGTQKQLACAPHGPLIPESPKIPRS